MLSTASASGRMPQPEVMRISESTLIVPPAIGVGIVGRCHVTKLQGRLGQPRLEFRELVRVDRLALRIADLRHNQKHRVGATGALTDQRVVIAPQDLVAIGLGDVLDYTGGLCLACWRWNCTSWTTLYSH